MQVGNIDRLDYACYEFCYQMMARTILPPTVLVYLNVDPRTAYERMKKRDRTEEAGVGLQYLIDLKAEYERLLSDIRRGLVPWGHSVYVHELVGDVDIKTEAEWEHMCSTIKDICKR